MSHQEAKEEIPGISELERYTGYFFEDRQTLVEALTHASFSNENVLSYCNERLEFLGDAVLELCVSSILFDILPGDEGILSHRRASIVCEDSLSAWAMDAGIPSLLRLGKGLSRSGGHIQPSLLANAAEAVFGAIFIDGGYVSAKKVINAYCEKIFSNEVNLPINPKATLQELMDKNGYGNPEYIMIKRTGPAHAPLFRVVVRCRGFDAGVGEGCTIKEAERKAAEKGLLFLEKRIREK